MITMSSGLSRWPRDIATGYYRSAVLVAVAGLVPCLTAAIAVFGLSFTRSWSDHFHAFLLARLGVGAGELAITALWVFAGFSLAMTVLGRPTTEFLRRRGGQWLGVEIRASYPPRRVVTKMATGYWWDGHRYHEDKWQARIQAWRLDHSLVASTRSGERDPQLRRDMVWQAVAAVTVVPVAALPLLFGAGAVYAGLAAPSMLWVAALSVASVACAPFAWRIFSPVGSRYLAPSPKAAAEAQVAQLKSIRADLTQTQAAELERIERSLHDGAQARMVALGMHLSTAERLVDTDPEQAKQILREARASSVVALEQLRTLVRGINPPVLVERGLVDAIRALALDAPIEVDVRSTLGGRPERPVEAALYFAAAELLTNVVKHAQATHAGIELSHGSGALRVVVSDDGTGGAAATPGSGLDGITRRLAAFEGRVDVDSPAGGPTRVTLTVPCELS